MVYTIVIADDITGANDIGIMYAKSGFDTVVYSYDRLEPGFVPEHEVTVIDTDSRFCTPKEAYRRVYDCCRMVGRNGAVQFIDKQCSVFRGNIGAEFDAMLDALGEKHGMVVLAFPDNGRTTIHGIHYVYGVKLEDSQFRYDPVHPMTQSSLLEILGSQTKRKVALVSVDVLDQGKDAVVAEKERLKKEASYLIFDARNNADLELLAEVLEDEPVICGSSAPGYFLGKQYIRKHGKQDNRKEMPLEKGSVLGIAGSLTPQTKTQSEYMIRHGYPVLTLDTRCLFDEKKKNGEHARILSEYQKIRESGGAVPFVMIRSQQDDALVAETKQIAFQKGIDNTTVSEMVSGELASLAWEIGQKYEILRYMILGGDTSGSFCRRFHISGMKVLKEIQPGLPTCQSITAPYYKLVLKSGSFGSEEFLETALNFMD